MIKKFDYIASSLSAIKVYIQYRYSMHKWEFNTFRKIMSRADLILYAGPQLPDFPITPKNKNLHRTVCCLVDAKLCYFHFFQPKSCSS